MSKDNLDLLIIEKANAVEFSKDSNYTFEGIFTEFGVRNKNRRIYEKEQFLPHLKELQETIKQNKLLGELDHPKDFEVMLARASHVIENLELDEGGNKIMGRIKLMDTAKGQDAKAIADAGVPLHISSRAAGSVNEQGVVTVKKLFTYDLVADPGFANAELSAVAESLSVSEDRAQEIIDMVNESSAYGSGELELINESLGITEEDGIDVYRIVKKTSETLKEDSNSLDQLSKNGNEKVTVEQLTKWSTVFIKEMKELVDGKIAAIEENKSNGEVEKVQTYLTEFSNEVNEKFAQFHQFVDYLSEGMNQMSEVNETLTENLDKLKDHNNYIIESLELVKGYAEKAHMEVADVKEHNNHIVEQSNNLAQFIDHVAEKANQGINYTESVSEGAKALTEFTENIAAEVAKISESTLSAENEKIEEMNRKTAKGASALAKEEGFEEGYEFYEYVLQSMDNGQIKQVKELLKKISGAGLEDDFFKYIKQMSTRQEQQKLKKYMDASESVKEEAAKKEDEKEDEKDEELDESLNVETSQYKDSLSQRINEALELAKKEKEASINTNDDGKKEFFELLPENYQKQFETLPDDKKQKLKEVSEKAENEEQATALFESFIAENKGPNWLDNKPEKFEAIWEKLDESAKAKITLQAESYELDTQARIDWFWETRSLQKTEQPIMKKAIADTLQESSNQLGYQINVDAIVNAVKGIHN